MRPWVAGVQLERSHDGEAALHLLRLLQPRQYLAGGDDGDGVGLPGGALGLGVEEADALDLVPPELDAGRLLGVHGEDVDDAAPPADLTGRVYARFELVSHPPPSVQSSSSATCSPRRRVWRAETKASRPVVPWERALAEATTSGAAPSGAASLDRTARRCCAVSGSVTSRSKGSASVSGKWSTLSSSPLHSDSWSWRPRASSGRGATTSMGTSKSRHRADSTKGAASGSTWVLTRARRRSRDSLRLRYWGTASSSPPKTLRLIRLPC